MDTVSVDQGLLEDYWNGIFGESDTLQLKQAKYLFIDSFRRLAAEGGQDTNLYLDGRAWKISVKEHLYHHLLVECITGAVFHHFGLSELSPLVVSSVIAVLTGPKRISIDKKDEEIYFSLIIDKKFQHCRTAEEWYAELPEDLRNQTNFLDFKETMDQLVYAGFAETRQNGYMIRERGKEKIRIHFSWS